jgi:hypothetical protein
MEVRASAACRSLLQVIVAAMLILNAMPLRADSLDSVTVEAQRNHKKLEHDVEVFVSSAIVKSYDESLMRWDHPVCPLVAGLGKDLGEFALHRFSDIARAAHVPLGKETCKPNFIVIVAPNSSTFLKILWRHKPRLFNTYHGIAPVRSFIDSSRPIKVWYNAADIGADGGAAFTSALAESAGIGMGTVDYPVHVAPSSMGSRLTRQVVRNIDTAMVIADSTQIRSLNIGQLVDYIALIGLVQINLDKDLGQTPSILQLFKPSETPPPLEMTPWDRALLLALYSTPQKDMMQRSEMETVMLREISRQTAQ